MAQVKCPNGHFYNDAIYNQCPYCNSPLPLPPPPPPAPSPSGSKTPWFVTGVAVLIAAFCLVQTSNAQRELDRINNALVETHQQLDNTTDKLSEISRQLEDTGDSADIADKIINLFRKTYGHGSDSFYASSPMVILNAGGEARKIFVYFNPNGESGTVQAMTLDRTVDARCLDRWSIDIECQWSSEAWNEHKKDFFIKPGNSRGYNIVHFSNDANNDTFDVLVIVK